MAGRVFWKNIRSKSVISIVIILMFFMVNIPMITAAESTDSGTGTQVVQQPDTMNEPSISNPLSRAMTAAGDTGWMVFIVDPPLGSFSSYTFPIDKSSRSCAYITDAFCVGDVFGLWEGVGRPATKLGQTSPITSEAPACAGISDPNQAWASGRYSKGSFDLPPGSYTLYLEFVRAWDPSSGAGAFIKIVDGSCPGSLPILPIAPITSLGTSPHAPISLEPINLANGNYVYQYQDLFIPGRGLPLTITRSYNSLNPISGPFGSGWTFNYNVNLAGIAGSGNVVVTREDGRMDVYNLNSDGTYSPPPGIFDTLTKNADGSYTLARKDQIKYLFTSAGKLTTIVDNNTNKISLTYTGGYLTKVTDPSGRELTLTYDAAGRIISTTDPAGRILSYTYDAQGNLIRYKNAMGGEYSYAYDENHWMTSITNPRGVQIMTNTYDGNGRVISQSNALSAVTTFSYDPVNRKTAETDPLGRKKIYIYDDHFWELSETDALGNTLSYAYDGNGNRISTINANGHTTKFVYDANGNIIQVIDPSGSSTTLSYDSKNNLVSGTDALGRQITLNYDANSNPVQITNTLGYVTTFAFDQYGQLMNDKDANGHVTSLAYDSYGNPTDITDALGNTETFSYDTVGRLVSATDAKSSTSTFSYDALDRLVSITDPLGHSASYSYDGVGNRIGFTDALGSTTSYSYDPLNQLTKVTDPMGGIVSYAYDSVYNLVAMTDANGHTTQYTYDSLNRLAAIADPLRHSTSYGYDAGGNKISMTDNNGDTTRLTYDVLDRLTGISYQDKTSASYTYDAVGNRLAMIDGSGTTSYAYDGLNRVTGVANSGGQVKYSYDPVGNKIQMTYPDGKRVSYAYDGVNRLSGLTDWNGKITSYVYDANGNVVGMTNPNGIKTEYAYDKDNRLIKLVNKDGEGIVSSYEYTRDAIGNRIRVNEKVYPGNSEDSQKGYDKSENGLKEASKSKDKESDDGDSSVTAYGYDKLSRLTKVTESLGSTVIYSYDPMGNRQSMVTSVGKKSSTIAYNYDAGDELLRAGGTTYTYDNDGNLIKKNEPETTTFYGYDAAGRLTSVSMQSPKHPPDSKDSFNEKDGDTAKDSFKDKDAGISLHFAYDGDGNRISKAVTSGKKTELTQYIWDVNTVLPQVLTEADGKNTALYTYGLGRISMTDPRGGQIYYQYDGVGSVRGLSNSRGNTRAVYYYDAFGEPRLTTDPNDNDFLFTGEQMDSETGLIYLRARYYDPEIGRFIIKDPVAGFAPFPPSLNRYTYAYNNPARFVDPSGKVIWWVPGVAGAVVNEVFYAGDVITGRLPLSVPIAAGRAAGGFVGGEIAAGTILGTLNPVAAGAAAGAAEYTTDILVQQGLQAVGIPGYTENPSWQGLAISTGGGALTGGISKYIVPPNVGRNPTQIITALTGKQMQKEIARSLIGNLVETGLGSVGNLVENGLGSVFAPK